MCGIAGCVGHEGAVQFVYESLEALESRGYDSAGLAYPDESKLTVVKAIGEVAGLESKIPDTAQEARTAIGHTRWATHGKVTIPNAHPHLNTEGTIAVVQNGIVENYDNLKSELQSEGYTFASETDTEVIPHLLDYYSKEGHSPEEAFTMAMRRLEGAYAVLAFFNNDPDTIYAAKVASPLVLGVNGSEHFAASIPNVLTDNTKKLVALEDWDMARLSTTGHEIKEIKGGRRITREPQDFGELNERAVLGEYPHFMLKEIHDSPETIRNAIRGRILPEESIVKLGGLESVQEKLRETERIIIVACGTSYHAGLIGERLIEEIAGLPVEVQIASEFKYRNEPLDRKTAVIAISQSGETADTRAAIEKAKEEGMLVLGINNAPGSTIDRITDAGVHCRAGEEVSVASTKAFTSQVTVLAEIALALSKNTNKLHKPLMEALHALPEQVEQMLENTEHIQQVAKKYANASHFLYIGRGSNYAGALEGALKLKEISYIHADGHAAGELKHGTIALVDEDCPTFAIATHDEEAAHGEESLYAKMVSNIQEIRARGGPVIALALQGNESIQEIADDVLFVPKTTEQVQPILNGIAMQLFAYHVAIEKGLNPDRPRNLAKSVTVE